MGMTTSDVGRKALEAEEGCVLHAYQDSRGIWTIGVGNTPAYEGEVWTQAQADHTFATRLANEFEPAVLTANPRTQNQMDACVSLAYNIGAPGFVRSTVAKDLKAGDIDGAADGFMMWVIPSELTARRQRERTMFLGEVVPSAAPDPVATTAQVQVALGIPADGVYGPVTHAAVLAFQKTHGLVADGIVGPRTLAAMRIGPDQGIVSKALSMFGL